MSASSFLFVDRLYKTKRCKCGSPLSANLYYYGDKHSVCERCFDSIVSPPKRVQISPIEWLVYEEGTRGPDNGIRGTNFDWDETGLWFSGDAGANTPAYPVYTKFVIPEKDRVEVCVDFIYDDYESKNFGLCVYVDGVIPEWKWDYVNPTRIAGQYDSSKSGPSLSGIRLTNEIEMEMEFDTVYTCKFVYDPVNKPYVVMETWIKGRLDENNVPIPESVSGIEPYLADRKYINETLPPGDYRVGFTADNDILPPNRTYLQNMTIRVIGRSVTTYTHTLSVRP